MKPWNYIVSFLLCIMFAAYLRMCFPLLSWVYWPNLVNEPAKKWIGAILGMPLFELRYFVFVYLIAMILFYIIDKIFIKNYNIIVYIFLGLISGFTWCLVFSISDIFFKVDYHIKELLFIYSIVGGLYGFLYYHWMSDYINNRLVSV